MSFAQWEPCPYGDCPVAPHECRCWEPDSHQGRYVHDEPCEACYWWTGNMQRCDRSCMGHTDRQWQNLMFGPGWDGRQLLKNGRKP